MLISVTSAGIINQQNEKKFALIISSVRDEGVSYHYLPPGKESKLNEKLLRWLTDVPLKPGTDFFNGTSWTTDAPYRETQTAIDIMKSANVTCVEMETAALYALAEAKKYNIICFAHLTNSMAQTDGDFEKGEEFGSVDTLNLISNVLKGLHLASIF